MMQLDANLIIVLAFTGIVVYGLLLGAPRAKMITLASFAGIVLATQLGPSAFEFAQTHSFVPGHDSLQLWMTQTALFGLALLLLSWGRVHSNPRAHDKHFNVHSLILNLLTAGMIVTSVLSFIDQSTRDNVLGSSSFATLIYRYHGWWIALTAGWLVIVSFWRQKPKEH